MRYTVEFKRNAVFSYLKQTNLSKNAWCKQNKVSVVTFSDWLKDPFLFPGYNKFLTIEEDDPSFPSLLNSKRLFKLGGKVYRKNEVFDLWLTTIANPNSELVKSYIKNLKNIFELASFEPRKNIIIAYPAILKANEFSLYNLSEEVKTTLTLNNQDVRMRLFYDIDCRMGKFITDIEFHSLKSDIMNL